MLVILALVGCQRMEPPAPIVEGRGGAEVPQERLSPRPAADVPPGVKTDFKGEVTVRAGQTLYGVSRELGVSTRSLIEANGLQPPYRLVTGQILKIPQTKQYIVQPGDTLYGLARRFSVDPASLARLNKIDPPYSLKKGVALVLPPAVEPLPDRTLAAVSPRGVGGTARAGKAEAITASALPPVSVAPSPNTQATPSGRGEAASIPTAPATALAPLPVITVPNGPGSSLGAKPTPQGTPPLPKAEVPVSDSVNVPPNNAVKTEPSPPVPTAQGDGRGKRPTAPKDQPSSDPKEPTAEPVSAVPVAEPASPGDADKVQNVAAALAAHRAPIAPIYLLPVRGKIVATFGPMVGGTNNDGINIAAPAGTTVVAAEAGTVAYTGNELKGFGNLLLIRHADGFITAYAHNQVLLVKQGEKVRRGQPVAQVGNTGIGGQPQLHFEMRRGSKPVDPLDHLPSIAGNDG